MVKFVIRDKTDPNKIFINNSRGVNEAIFKTKNEAKRFAKNMTKTTPKSRRFFGKLIVKKL